MKYIHQWLSAVLLLAATAVSATMPAPAASVAPVESTSTAPPGFWQTPTVKGFGKMHPLPKAAYQPQPSAIYKIVFAVTRAADHPDEVNPGLDHVARAVNLYVSAGVPLDHLKFVAVISGPATRAIMDELHYKQALSVDNPNLPLIHALRAAGVDVVVCGQAVADGVAEGKMQYEWIAPEVTLALSAMTTVAQLEKQGYALLTY